MELPLLDIMYKWNHTVCSLLCLSPLSINFSVFLHVVVHISTASNFLALVWISTVFSLPLLGSPTACSPRKPGWCSSNVNQITSLLYLESSKGFLFYLENSFFFLLYNIVLVLPYINMNPPQGYRCSPSWTPLPPPSTFSTHNAMRLNINCRKKTVKNTKTWKLQNTFLNNKNVTEEIKREI